MNFVGIMARNVGLTEREVLPVALEEQPRQRRTIISDIALPGFRFHPTEEELVDYYLKRMVQGKRNSVELIALLDLYQYDPWELPALAFMGEREWFFYCPRDKKYPNGARPNRVTTSGYWKATGTDRAVRSTTADHRCIGLKKTLVFYTGRAPRGIKTDWIMNEYRIPVDGSSPLMSGSTSISEAICSITMTQSGYQRFFTKNDVALCRIYRKSSSVSSAGMHHLESKPREGVAGSSLSHEHLISTAENALQNSAQKVISIYNYNYSQQQLQDSPVQMLQGPSVTPAAAAATLSSSSVFHDQLHPETASRLLSSHAVMARLLEENCCYDGCCSQPIMSIDSRIRSTHGGTIHMQQQIDTDMGVSNGEGSVPRGSKTSINTSDSSKVDGSFEREGPFIDMFRQLRRVQHLDTGPPGDSLRSTVAGQPATAMNDVRILKGCYLTTTEDLPKLEEQRAVQSCSQMQRIYHNNNCNTEFHPRLQLPTTAEYWGDGDRCTPSASKSQETSSSARLELDALSSLTFT